MALTTADVQAWKPEIDAYIEDERKKMPKSVYKELFTVRSVDRLQMNEVTYSGDQKLPPVGQLEDAAEINHIEGYQTSYGQQNYRAKETFSSLLLATDQTGVVEKMARNMARKPEYSRNLEILSVLRRAWDSTKIYGDGKSLISTVHPRKDGGGTQTNTFGDGYQKPLTYDNALELQDQLIAQVSNSGTLISAGDSGRNKVIVVSPYLREDAFQVAGVEGPDMEPDTAENNANYFRKGDKFDVLVTKWIGYEAAVEAGETTVAKTSTSNYWDSMWFILDVDYCKDYWKVYELEGYPQYADEVTKSNEAMIKYAYDAYAYGVTSPLGCVGSKGDNTDYTS